MDRTYWHVPGARSWHALFEAEDYFRYGECGRNDWMGWSPDRSRCITEVADRVPPTAHLCGSCARVIAARTDIEDAKSAPSIANRLEDVPEPVASEQDDYVAPV